MSKVLQKRMAMNFADVVSGIDTSKWNDTEIRPVDRDAPIHGCFGIDKKKSVYVYWGGGWKFAY